MRGGGAGLIDHANNCTGNRELDQVARDPTAKDLCRQRLYCERDQVGAGINQRHQDSQLRAPGRAPRRYETGTKHSQKERHDDMTQNQPREVGFGS